MDLLILGGIGLLINSKLKKIMKNQEKILARENIEKSNDYKIDQEDDIDDKDIIEAYIKYISKAEEIIRGIKTFEDAKILHGIINNSIAFSKKGYIFITSYGESKLIEIDNIVKISISEPNEIESPLLYYLIINTKNYEQNEFKMLLTVRNKNGAEKLFDEIREEIELIKKEKN